MASEEKQLYNIQIFDKDTIAYFPDSEAISQVIGLKRYTNNNIFNRFRIGLIPNDAIVFASVSKEFGYKAFVLEDNGRINEWSIT